jgi:hypothetical protein
VIFARAKKKVRNRAKPEGCMALRYMYDEALRFMTKDLALYPHIRCQIWDANEKDVDANEVLSGNGASKMLSFVEMEMIHEHVITNFVATKTFYRYFNL